MADDFNMPDLTESPLARLFLRARSALSKGSLDEAVRLWRGLIAVDPDNVEAMERLATALRGLGRIAEAEAVLRTAIERAPERASLRVGLGATLMGWEAYEKAAEAYARAAVMDPTSLPARIGLGRACLAGGDAVAAEASFRDALVIDPRSAPALVGLGDSRRRLGDVKEARKQYAAAVVAAPKDATARTRLAESDLRLGNYAEGWVGLEWRHRMLRGRRLDPGLPFWDGQPLGARRLLVRAEGGLAETIQFFRLLRALPTQQVVFEVDPAMVEILQYSGWFRGSLVARGDDLPGDLDSWAPILSLPGLLNMDGEAIPAQIPYLRPDAAMRSAWRSRFGTGINLGLHWSAGPSPFDDMPRAVPLKAFAPLAKLPRTNLISLQKGTGRQEVEAAPFQMQDWTAEMDETGSAFLDTITAISAMDAVVSADTAIAHLAGALGVPVWVVMPAPGSWVWGPLERQSPWYPSARLVRKPANMGWEEAFRMVAEEIRLYLSQAG